jgi:hypothetical protein
MKLFADFLSFGCTSEYLGEFADYGPTGGGGEVTE